MLEENRILMQAAKASSIPVKPNNTRWNSAFYAAQSCVGIRATLDALVDRFQGDYALEVLTEDNWRCINQCLTFLRPFKEFSKYKEGENYVTNSELLFRLWEACYTAFYSNPFDDEALDYRVRDLKQQIRCDIGERLHACCNLELLWAGIALHPTFKGLSVPDDIHQNFMNENGGRSIPNFFKNAKRWMKESLSAMLDNFGVAQLVVEEPVPAFTFNEKLVGNFNPAAAESVPRAREISQPKTLHPSRKTLGRKKKIKKRNSTGRQGGALALIGAAFDETGQDVSEFERNAVNEFS
jgi:hypothetical protein